MSCRRSVQELDVLHQLPFLSFDVRKFFFAGEVGEDEGGAHVAGLGGGLGGCEGREEGGEEGSCWVEGADWWEGEFCEEGLGVGLGCWGLGRRRWFRFALQTLVYVKCLGVSWRGGVGDGYGELYAEELLDVRP